MKKLLFIFFNSILLPLNVLTCSSLKSTMNVVHCEKKYDLSSTMELYACEEKTFVTTPNGSAVRVIQYKTDFPADVIEKYDLEKDSEYPYATRIGSTSLLYNCHSYAWYLASTSNPYCMEDPSPYYIDKSYVEVTTPRSGDVICYFDDGGTPNTDSDDFNIHSGIVVSYDSSISSNGVCGNSNQVVVRSKWGSYGLYEHKGDYCPYVSTFQGTADYVKYYRHYHNYINHYCGCGAYTSDHHYHGPYQWRSYTMHLSVCGCGATKELPHAVSSDAFQNHKDRLATCLLCGGKAEIGFTQITSSNKEQYVTLNGSFILPNGVIVLVDEDFEDYLNGNLVFMKRINGLENQ